MAASLFLAAYETLSASVIEQIQTFFTFGFDQNGPIVDDAYRLKVLALDASPLRASLLWLKEHNVIDEDDMKSVTISGSIATNSLTTSQNSSRRSRQKSTCSC